MFDWLKCLLGDHDWTCDAEENIPPPSPTTVDEVAGVFHRFARPWCKRCRQYMQSESHLRGSEHWDADVRYREPV